MARTSLSADYKDSLMAGETSFLSLWIIDITHPYLETPVRLVQNFEDISYNGNTYLGCDMRIYRPDEKDNSRYVARIEVDNTDQVLTPAIRSFRGLFVVTSRMVSQTSLSADPPEFDTLELGPISMSIESIEWNAQIARLNLIHRNIALEKFPKYVFDNVHFPGGQ